MTSNQHLDPGNDAQEHTGSETDEAERPSGLRDRIIPLGAFAIVIILLVLFAYTLYTPSDSSLGAGGRVNNSGSIVEVDDREAPQFTLQTFDGEEVSLSDYAGKSVIINFWASWCPPCRDEAPILNEFHEQASERDDVVLLGIAVWDEEAESRSFMQQYNLSFTNLSDESGSVLIDYGVYGIPETYFISPEGRLVGKYRGPLESSEHIQELRQQFEQGAS